MSRVILGGGINQDSKRKFLDDGSEWERIFWHDVSTTATYFSSKDEAKNCNLSNRYSKLSTISSFVHNGNYEFLLYYPKYSTTKYNRWIQKVNPLDITADSSQTASTMGYQPIHINFTTNWLYGMGLTSNTSSTSPLLDCEAGHNNWYGGIGLRTAYNGGFPAPTESGMSNIQKEVELWVRIYRDVKIVNASNVSSKIIYLNTQDDFISFLNDINDGITYEGKTVYLNTDLWWSAANKHQEFFSSGDNTHKFMGVFDGQGHTATLHYKDTEQAYSGLIGYNAGVIRNINVTNMYWDCAGYAGLICGYNEGLIELCRSIRFNKSSILPKSIKSLLWWNSRI